MTWSLFTYFGFQWHSVGVWEFRDGYDSVCVQMLIA